MYIPTNGLAILFTGCIIVPQRWSYTNVRLQDFHLASSQAFILKLTLIIYPKVK